MTDAEKNIESVIRRIDDAVAELKDSLRSYDGLLTLNAGQLEATAKTIRKHPKYFKKDYSND